MRTILQGFLDLLYPPICYVCRVPLASQSGPFCSACHAALLHEPHSTCPRCAGTVGPFTHVAQGCLRCRTLRPAFAAAVSLGPYEGLLRDVVLRMKHAHGEDLAEHIGELWVGHRRDRLQSLQADVVVPIPLHWWRRFQRGYNQSETLAATLAKGLGIPLQTRWLRRIRNTPMQTRAGVNRAENVKDAFAAVPRKEWQGRTVLLVDDVMTSGHTANEAARALKKAGAGRVVVAALARGRRRRP